METIARMGKARVLGRIPYMPGLDEGMSPQVFIRYARLKLFDRIKEKNAKAVEGFQAIRLCSFSFRLLRVFALP